MTTPVTASKSTLECAAVRPTAGSIAQLKKMRSRTQRVMRQLKQLMVSPQSPVHQAQPHLPMVDLVASLFHGVLKNEHLSPLTRVWVARLQVPILRQAMLDPLAFEDPAHPARLRISAIVDARFSVIVDGVSS